MATVFEYMCKKYILGDVSLTSVVSLLSSRCKHFTFVRVYVARCPLQSLEKNGFPENAVFLSHRLETSDLT